MITLQGMPCDAEEVRSRLSHDWLGNKLLILQEEDVVQWHATRVSAGVEFERRLLPGGLYAEEMDNLYRLISGVQDGYSPARVVESGPLSDLPSDTQKLIKETLHQLYLALPLRDSHGIEALQEALKQAADAFSRSLSRFREVWFAQPSASAEEVGATFRDVLRDGRLLRAALDHLPRGYVLP